MFKILNVKLILLCFEAMSGLKVDLLKSETIVLGCAPKERTRLLPNVILGSPNCR